MSIGKIMTWRVILTLCIVLALVGGGCTNKQTDNSGQTAKSTTKSAAQSGQTASMLVANKQTFDKVAVYRENNGLVWVPLVETAKSLGMDVHRSSATFALGSTDASYFVTVDQNQAFAGDKPLTLPQTPRYFNQKPYLTTQSLSVLLGTPVKWDAQRSHVVLTPVDDKSLAKQSATPADGIRSLALTNKRDIINFADNFMGTPYKFAAGPYNQTRAFDCSSYVQYVYGHFGVKLPRSSRSQAKVGRSIDSDQLQVGDIMYFYTPGRFASNRTVGHVGIYKGNGQIIHTYGEPGVTVSDFNNYWKGRFLFAKRVA
jgi:cell wall-associated NlpC family hydrolase